MKVVAAAGALVSAAVLVREAVLAANGAVAWPLPASTQLPRPVASKELPLSVALSSCSPSAVRDRCASSAALCGNNSSSARYRRSLFTCSGGSCRRSLSAVRRYQSSAMCSSLEGSHSRAATNTETIFAHGTCSFAGDNRLSHSSSSPVPRHSASARYTSPNWRGRSMRMPFKRTGTVRSACPSSNSRACSGEPTR